MPGFHHYATQRNAQPPQRTATHGNVPQRCLCTGDEQTGEIVNDVAPTQAKQEAKTSFLDEGIRSVQGEIR